MDWDDVGKDVDPGFAMTPPENIADPGFDMAVPQGDVDPGMGTKPGREGILDGLRPRSGSSSLHLLLEPQDIAAVSGLPAHVYESAGVKSLGDHADQRVQQEFAGLGDLSGAARKPALPFAPVPTHAIERHTLLAPRAGAPAPSKSANPGESGGLGGLTLDGTGLFNDVRTEAMERQARSIDQATTGFAKDVHTPWNYPKLAADTGKWAGRGFIAADALKSGWDLWHGKPPSEVLPGLAVDGLTYAAGGVPGIAIGAANLAAEHLYPGGWKGMFKDSAAANQRQYEATKDLPPLLRGLMDPSLNP